MNDGPESGRRLHALFKRLAASLLYSNVFVALCAMALTRSSFILLKSSGTSWTLVAFNGLGGLSLYLALRLDAARRHGAKDMHNSGRPKRLLWVERNRFPALIILSISALCSGVLFFKLPVEMRWLIMPALLPALAYGWPFLRVPDSWILRRRPLLKIVLIAWVWAWMTAFLPWLGMAENPPLSDLLWLFSSRFLLIAACTLPFDIRDIELDRVSQLETLPTVFGVQRSRHLSWFALGLSALLMLPLMGGMFLRGSLFIAVALALPLIYAAWIIRLARPDGREFLYLGLLDGTVIVQWVFLEMLQFALT